ncbi:MAG TPA: translation initiation factor IF-2 [Tepidisphaeraceae bacterium]|nr:translation initiation factor IF-2 [Tepidisphaeraceae bacterium]
MAKGIRVNQLAKELGVESKAILAKCREEGLGEKVPNHMSVLSVGLSETVREWFSGGGGGTAVEVAPPVEVKPKRPKVKKKIEGELSDDHGSHDILPETTARHTTAEEPSIAPTPAVEDNGATTLTPTEPPAVAPELHAEPVAPDAAHPPTSAPAHPETAFAPAPATPVEDAPAVSDHAPGSAVAHPPTTLKPAAHAPAAQPAIASPAAGHAPTTAAHTGPVRPSGPGIPRTGTHPPTARPTVSLKSGGGHAPATVERKAVIPAPQLDRAQIAPAQMKGPNVVRVEKPESVPVPGGRGGPRGPRQSDTPTFTQARPATGRGVRVTDEDEEETKKKAAAAKAGRTNSQRRRGGIDGRRGEAMEKLREFSEADLAERKSRIAGATTHRAATDRHMVKAQQRGTHILAKTGLQKGEPIHIEEPITVKSLSAALGVKGSDIQLRLLKQGIQSTPNYTLEREIAEMLALDYGADLQIAVESTMEEDLIAEFASYEQIPENMITRPPVVTILGHVDHGKTSLLDKIRKANVAAGEAGGITQHTAAWMVQIGEGAAAKRVTFIDTPGHQAFTSMRARGADMTDVVVLVVSAAEGVQPQTIESINHAKAAGKPIVVAMNKIDRPDANEQQVLGQLAGQGLNPVEWGGDVEVIRTSATTGQGISDLIEILDYQSQLLDLKTDPSLAARGTVIEARMDPGLGPIATVLVQDGSLHNSDVILAGPGYGRVRMMLNDLGKPIEEANASTPVVVSGFTELPSAGDRFYQVDDLDRARAIAADREMRTRATHLGNRTQVTRDNLNAVVKAGEAKTIHLIIKADVQGSVETLAKSVTDMNTEEVRVKVIHSGAGGITESDVELAMATRINPENKDHPHEVAIVGFNVVPEEKARALAEQNHISVKVYRVIYEIFDDLKKALSGMLTPEVREKLHGHAEIRAVIKVSKVGNVAGCLVTDGHIQRGSRLRLTRGGSIITEDLAIESLKRLKDDVKEVKSGLECGIKIANYDDIKIGDILEAYIRETIQRTL